MQSTGRRGAVAYRAAVSVAVVAATLLAWGNLAVGIIGNEDQPANLLYFGMLGLGFVAAVIARFRPFSMAYILFAMATVQLFIPAIALIIWPNVSWGSAGMVHICILNAVFALLFAGSALLFLRASTRSTPTT